MTNSQNSPPPCSESSMDLGKVHVLIPALNEEATIGNVIAQLKSKGLSKITVIDNGSTDQTAQVVKDSGAHVIHEARRSYGQACWSGMEQLSTDTEWVLFCDADGSDDLDQLDEFFKEAPNYDFLLANRRATKEGREQLSPVQSFGNWLSGTLIFLGWGAHFHDLGPLRMIRKERLDQIEMKDRGFGWTIEMQARAAELGLRYKELSAKYLPRKGGSSKISGTIRGSFMAGTIILSTLGKLWLQRPVIQNSLKVLSLIFLFAGLSLMLPNGDFRDPQQTRGFLIASGIASLGFILSWPIQQLSWKLFWTVATGSRVLLLFMYPGDDIFRYLWEGMIQNHGVNPYQVPPADPSLEYLRTEWWSQINHRSVAALYPPVTLFGFSILSLFSVSILFFKFSFVVAELLGIWLLSKRFDQRQLIIWGWNPLAIYCIAGGGHFEGWFLLALVVAWLWSDPLPDSPRRSTLSCLAFGVSIAIKLFSGPLAVWVMLRQLQKESWARFFIGGALAALPFTLAFLWINWPDPGMSLPGRGFAESARSASFFPWLTSLVWPESLKMNWIFAIPAGLATLWILFTTATLRQFAERFFFCFFLCSPAIHVWYFTWMVPFAVASQNLGTRLVCISGFLYFILQLHVHTDRGWTLEWWQRLLLWFPFIIGFVWSLRSELHSSKKEAPS